MILSINKVAEQCFVSSFNKSLDLHYDKIMYSNLTPRGIYDRTSCSDKWFCTGLDFAYPFKFSMWEVYTLYDSILKRYYFLTLNDLLSKKINAYPIYVTAYHIPLSLESTTLADATIPNVTLLLKGIGAWASFYESKDLIATTYQNMYLRSMFNNSFTNVSVKESFLLDLAMMSTSSCGNYNYSYEFDSLNSLMALAECEYNKYYSPNEGMVITDDIKSKLYEHVLPSFEKIPCCEYDYLFKRGAYLDLSILKSFQNHVSLDPIIQQEVYVKRPPLTYSTDQFSPFIPLSFIKEVSDRILRAGYFIFCYEFDTYSQRVITDFTWDINNSPTCSNIYELISIEWPELTHIDCLISKLKLQLIKGQLEITLVYKDDTVQTSYYCLTLHMIGSGEIIIMSPYSTEHGMSQYFTNESQW